MEVIGDRQTDGAGGGAVEQALDVLQAPHKALADLFKLLVVVDTHINDDVVNDHVAEHRVSPYNGLAHSERATPKMKGCNVFYKRGIAPLLHIRYMDGQMLIEKEEAEFTLSEVSAVTGFNAETIRAWRKRKHLSPLERYAKIGLRELASLAVRKQLLNHGFGPADSRSVGDAYAASVIYAAILDTPGSCEVHGTAAAIAAFEEAWGDDNGLGHTLAETDGRTVLWLISTDGGELVPDVELDVGPDSLTGYYIHLQALGNHVGAAAGKPLFKVRVKLDADEPGRVLVRRVPRMTRDLERRG